MTERNQLSRVETDVLHMAKGHPAIASLHGIGSYFKRKAHPKDVDFFIRLKTDWTDPKTYALAQEIYALQNKHRTEKGDSLLNVFVEGPDRSVLDITDLWFIFEQGESLEDNIKGRKEDFAPYIPAWRKAPIITATRKQPARKRTYKAPTTITKMHLT